MKAAFYFETSALEPSSVFKTRIVCDYEILTEAAHEGKMFPGRPFSTNPIYQYVIRPHHVMILRAIYSFVRNGGTFDQCV